MNKIEKTKNITRIVIILTDSFNDKNLQDILKEINQNIEQLTFKILHDSEGYNKELDKYIKEHKTNEKTINKLKKEILNYKGNISIVFDENCMDANNRYMVFREDGNLYKDFASS